jgi:predicted MPP superfamily phosphohydrolase
LAGAGELYEDHRNLNDVLGKIPDLDCRIVLVHNPVSVDTPFLKRIDLMMSGHTDGGQVNISFVDTPILPVKNKNYSSGMEVSPRGRKVFISKGIGWTI